jgi:hypothetical protein
MAPSSAVFTRYARRSAAIIVSISAFACGEAPRRSPANSPKVPERTAPAVPSAAETPDSASAAPAPPRDGLASPPQTLDEWRAIATPLRAATRGGLRFTVDRADRWIVVADTIAVGFERASGRVRMINLRSGAERQVGRLGAGPLEFSTVAAVGAWSGDSVVIMDSGLMRATVLSALSGAGRTFAYASVDSALRGDLVGAAGATGLVFRSLRNNTERGEAGMYRAEMTLHVVPLASGVPPQHIALAGYAGFRIRVGGGMINGNAPVTDGPLVAPTPSGLLSIPVGTDSLFALRAPNPPTLIKRLGISTVALSGETRRRILDGYLSKFAKSPPEVVTALREKMVIPARVSPLDALWSGADATSWTHLVFPEATDAQTVWIQWNAEGALVRCVRTDRTQRVLAFTGTQALVATEHDDGEFVVTLAPLPERFG